MQWHAALRKKTVQLADHRGGARTEVALQLSALALEMVQDRPRSRHRQRVADVRAREKRHAHFRE